MPLTLITGPANSAKAGAILDRARALAGRSPLLVVPGGADVDHYRRELAASGTVLGVSVVVFERLLDTVITRAGTGARPPAPLARTQVAAAATAATALARLGPSARTPGFPAALARFADELAEHRVTPERFAAAMHRWAADDPGRRSYAGDLVALVSADTDLQRHHGLRSRPAVVATALDALRERPALWAGTPVLLYGFDDLGRLQQDVIESLAGPVGAEVILALTYEPGREAFAARAALYQDLLAIATHSEHLEASAEHYAPAARVALHHVERGLFEDDRGRCETATGIRLLSGSGERAELELAAAEIAARIAAGEPAETIAVVHRGLGRRTDLVRQVFRAAGVPVALRTPATAGHTLLGRGLLALLRCALGTGDAGDVVTWLRTPGVLKRPSLADAFEADLREQGVGGAARAAELWAGRHWEIDAVGRLREAATAGSQALCEALERQLWRLLAGWDPGGAPVFASGDEAEPRAAAALLAALSALGRMAPELRPSPGRLEQLLAEVEFSVGERPGPGRVTVTEPQRLRARRVRRLYLLGLGEGVFPAPPRPEPFLGDDDRRDLAAASGVLLRLHEDAADIERLFFYAEASRAECEFVAGWHETADDGKPRARSPFLDELCDLLPEGWEDTAARRQSAAAGWPRDEAPTEREALRHEVAAGPRRAAQPIRPPVDPVVLAPLAERTRFSASALELWISCPVRWFVERHLRPDALEPDPEPLARGDVVHRVLERVVAELSGRPGGVAAQPLAVRRECVGAALAEASAARAISVNAERLRIELRRVEIDLLAYLEWLSRAPSPFVPSRFELRFGGGENELPAVALGAEFTLSGRVDRVDVADARGEAIIYDYKGPGAPVTQTHWADEGRLQLPLYLRAVEELLSLRGAGAFYQPIGRRGDQRPRGVVSEGVDPGFTPVRGDTLSDDELETLLGDAADRALAAAHELRAGAIEPRPESCAHDGGCSYPVICRCTS